MTHNGDNHHRKKSTQVLINPPSSFNMYQPNRLTPNQSTQSQLFQQLFSKEKENDKLFNKYTNKTEED